MLAIFLQTLPFFAVIGVGYAAARSGLFDETAAAVLTKFVFYFALSAMLFRLSANLEVGEIFDPQLAAAYLLGTFAVYLIGFAAARYRRQDLAVSAVEAQCAAIGNTGFLGVPMLALILGERAVPAILMVLMLDSVLFSSLLTILVVGSRGGVQGARLFRVIGRGLLTNTMVMSILLGLAFSASGLSVPVPANEFLILLGNAATPGALFAIGASLASKSAERVSVAAWLSAAKLFLHPLAVMISALWLFQIEAFEASVLIAAASLPVAGNIFILAQHYGVAAQRVSASILISTLCSIVTVSVIIALVTGGGV